MEQQVEDNDGRNVDIDENEGQTTKEMAWYLHDLKDSGRGGTLAFQVIQNLCTNYNVKEPADLVEAHSINKDRISSIT